jgi:phosphohistidine phosphatase SixA
MRRRIILMRHAKSSWQTGVSDHERPLNNRGRKDAPRIAQRLVHLQWVPELVHSSDSARTRETWSAIAPVFGRDIHVSFHRELYLAGIGAAETVLEGVSSTIGTVLLLGHNPGWEDICAAWTGQRIQMTTANAVLLESSSANWVDAVHGASQWQIQDVLRPRPPRDAIPK